MILQALVRHYEALEQRNEISPPGWSKERVHYALILSHDGTLKGIFTLMEPSQEGEKPKPQIRQVPQREVKTVGVKSNFLCENAMYMLGIDINGNAKRTQEAFAACKTLHQDILSSVDGIAARAVCGFFRNWQPECAENHPALQDIRATLDDANFVFCLESGAYMQDDPAIRQAWTEYKAGQAEAGRKIRCLVTGSTAPAERIHGKVKGVPGAQSAGANLVSFNADSFRSYGQNGETSPSVNIGQYAAFAHVAALNHLLADREYRGLVGDTVVLYWAEDADPQAQQAFALFSGFGRSDDKELLKDMITPMMEGRPLENVDISKQFYVLGIAPNAARLSVRFYLQDSLGGFLENLRCHYKRLEIIQPVYDVGKYLTPAMMLYETVNPKSTDKAASPLLSGAVLRSILHGEPYPLALYQAILRRIKAERNITWKKAAIIKACLLQKRYTEEELTVALNPELHDRAYILGRLFSVLERAQQEASPGLNTTIKDRYFTSASTTPGIVFPQLLRLAGHHTSKAEHGKWREKEIGELLSMIDADQSGAFPAQHNLNEQGLFILGYYQQTQNRYMKKEEQ